MLGAATFYNHMRPEVLRTHETIRYESSAVAVRVCPIHQESLDDEGCCLGGEQGKHCPDWWEVRWQRNGVLEPEVLCRASWDDSKHKEHRPRIAKGKRPRSSFSPARRMHYLAEAAYYLRRRGVDAKKAREIAETRWANSYAIWKQQQTKLRSMVEEGVEVDPCRRHEYVNGECIRCQHITPAPHHLKNTYRYGNQAH